MKHRKRKKEKIPRIPRLSKMPTKLIFDFVLPAALCSLVKKNKFKTGGGGGGMKGAIEMHNIYP